MDQAVHDHRAPPPQPPAGPVPAALIHRSPWRIVANDALRRLVPGIETDEATFAGWWVAPAGMAPPPLAAGQPHAGRLRVPAAFAGGRTRLLHADLEPVAGEHAWRCHVLDLSAAEDDHQRRAQTLCHLRSTLDRLQDLVSLVQRDERLLFVNVEHARFYGTTPERAEHRSLMETMGPANHAVTAPYRNALFETGEPTRYERTFIDRDGHQRVVDVNLRPIKDAQGRIVRMATFSRDVTARHHGLEAIRRTLERLDALFEAGIEGILLCEDGVVRDANPVAASHLGTTVAALTGRALGEVLAPLGLPAGDTGPDGPVHWCRLPSRAHPAPLQIRRVELPDGPRPCVAVLLQDMSYRLQAQRRIDQLVSDLRQQTARATAADRSKSVFLASASHDLRQPIHSLGLFLTTIQSLIRSGAPLQQATLQPIARRMRASLRNLTELLDALLGASMQHAEREAIARQPLALQTAFDSVVADFAPQALRKGLHLHAVPSRAWVMTDPILLRRILANFVANAVRYTERGRVLIGARQRGDQVEIQVWDSGVGIAPEQIGAIFEAFHRVDLKAPRGERAEGLGLSIVQRAAQALGATLDVRSTPRRGSMFSVTQPRCEAPAPPPRHEPAQPLVSAAAGLCVLLIDDDELVRGATVSLLTTWGHQVLVAPDAGEALRLWGTAGRRIDAVICDYMSDAVLDDMERLLGLVGADGQRPPVCMITGDVSPQRMEQARHHGFALLHKPVSAADLQAFLSNA